LKKKILILSYSDLEKDPRVQRQLLALCDHELETCGYAPSSNPELRFYPIYESPLPSLFRKLKRGFQYFSRNYKTYYWDEGRKKLAGKLKDQAYDLIVANDIQTLPLALAIAGAKTKVYFDAHEFHPAEFSDRFLWRIFERPYIQFLCRTYIPRANCFTSVSEAIADGYQEFVGIRPEVITNAGIFYPMEPTLVDPGSIRIIHHGAAIPSRKIELMVELAKLLDDRFSAYFMLTSTADSDKYLEELKKMAGGHPRIFFLSPVEPKDIVPFTNKFDIGLFLLPPTNYNYLHALPNKLFEFVQARLCIAIGPSPEMARVVNEFDLGLVSSSFDPREVAKLLNALTAEQIAHYKKKSHAAAHELSAEKSIKKIQDLINDILFI
jgi:hypothetical protein